jgi:diaminohydroxyphosphoribosylaminopyrimidine deaminase/5-amino-6-(5-phosphoribosylamino)uracil reductase
MVFCVDDRNRSAIESGGAEVIRTREAGGRVDPAAVLGYLAELGVNDVLVEAGPALCGALLEVALVDELVIYQAPHMMGSETRGMVKTPAWRALDERLELDIEDVRKIGNDLRITARPKT